jgi:hypothetical protein
VTVIGATLPTTLSECITTFFGDVLIEDTLYADCTIYLENSAVDCTAAIAGAIVAALAAFVCEDYATAGSGTDYATALGVCDLITPNCSDCISLVGLALDEQYANNCL